MPYLHLWKLTGAQTKPSSIIFSQVFCSAAIDQKRKLYKKAIGSKLSLDWQTFKFERRRVSRLLRHIRRTYVVRTLNVNKTDRKGFWREIGKKNYILASIDQLQGAQQLQGMMVQRQLML